MSSKLWTTKMLKITKPILIFLVIFSWIFSGWPQVWHSPRIPPKIQKTQAATGLSVAKGTLLVPSATGQQTITTGFEVKAVFFWVSNHSTTGSFQVDAAIGYGFASGSGVGNQYAITVKADDNITTNQAKPRFQNDAAILMITDANPGAVTLEANIFESFATTATGFKLDWVTVNANVVVHYMALGGSDITNVATGNFTAFGATGNVAVTGVGFQPDYVQFLSDGKATAFPGTGGKGINIGHAISSTNRAAVSMLFKAQNNKAGKAGGHQLTTRAIINSKGPTSIEADADFVSMDTDGFTINVTTAKRAMQTAYFAIKGVDLNVALGVETQNTTTGTKATTGLGFQPEALMMWSWNAAASGSGKVDATLSIGGSDGTNEDSLWAGNEDNPASNTNADTYINSTKAIMMGTPGATPSLDAEADLSSFDSDGFTLDWTTADATAREFIYLTFGGTDPAPNVPSQDSPVNSATGISITPTFAMTATDANSDDLSYKVTIYSNSACTAVVSTNDQAITSTGWANTNATCANAPTSCYSSGTQGNFTVQSGDALSNNTQYWWKVSAKDPDGSNTFTDSTTCNTFTTTGGAVYSVSLSGGTIYFGSVELGLSTTTVGNGYQQTATNDGDDMQLNVKTSITTGGATPWNNAATISLDNYKLEVSTTSGSSFMTFQGTDTYLTASSSMASGNAEILDFQFTSPSSSSDFAEKTFTITVQAVAP